MKKIFTLSVEDDAKVLGLQVSTVIQRKSDGEKAVTFFTLSDNIRENDEWLFKIDGKAERIAKESEHGA